MPFEDVPWSKPTLADFGDDVGAYCAASLIDLNEGGEKTAGLCKMPLKRGPGKPYNMGAMRAAASVLAGGRGGVSAPPEAKKGAARKLYRLFREAKMEPGENLRRMAGA